jgi:hypothetical protein
LGAHFPFQGISDHWFRWKTGIELWESPIFYHVLQW